MTAIIGIICILFITKVVADFYKKENGGDKPE